MPTLAELYQPPEPGLINSGPPADDPDAYEDPRFPGGQSDLARNLASLRRDALHAEQERSLMQHAEYAQGLVQRQDQLNLRKPISASLSD